MDILQQLISIDNRCFTFGANGRGQIGNNQNDSYVDEPFEIKLNNDTIIDGMVGEEHTVLLTNKNNVVTMGNNSYNECSIELTTDIVKIPHILSKISEIGIKDTNFIQKVIALNHETIIIV